MPLHLVVTRYWPQLSAVVAVVVLIGAQSAHVREIKASKPGELDVAMPIPAQLVLALGDRYLAANVGSIRATMVSTFELKPETYEVLANVHSDVAFLNPADRKSVV